MSVKMCGPNFNHKDSVESQQENKNVNRLILVGIIMLLGMVITSTPTILSILGEPTHRVISLKENLINVFKATLPSKLTSMI